MSKKPFPVYVVNEYIGGCPMDSHCHGVFTTLEKAKDCYNSYLLDIQTNNEEITENLTFNSDFSPLNESCSCYWDIDDFWGGLEIVKVILNQ